MSNEAKKTTAAPDAPKVIRPQGLINLMAKYPQYNGGDARVLKVGTRMPAVHAKILGFIDLPKTLKDEKTGEMKDWTGMVLDLLQPAPADDPEAEEDAPPRWYVKGDRIMMTVSKVLERPEIRAAANHPNAVFEVYIEPEVSKTKDNKNLIVYPVFEVGKPIKREAHHQVANAALALADKFAPEGALPMANATAPALPAAQAATHPAV
jgi:hypothetical protein